MAGISPYQTISELLGTKIVVSDLLRELAKIPRSDVLRCLASLTTLIGREHSHSPQEQFRILHNFAPREMISKIEAALRERNELPSLFFRRQLWFVWQMALIACNDDSTMEHSEETQRQVGLCLLMGSEVLKDVENAQRIDHDETSTLRFAVTTLISVSEAVIGSEVIARSHLFWLEMHEDAEIKRLVKEMGIVPVNESFEKAYGVPLDEFIRFSFLLYYKFTESTLGESPSALMFDSTQAFRNYFTPEHIANSLSLLSTTPDALASRLFGTPRQSWALDSIILVKAPLLEVAQGKYVCFDLHIFRAFLMQGVFELLADAVGYDKMKQILGGLFERYIERLMLNFAPKSKLIVTPYFNNVAFAAGKNQEVCDGLLLWPSFGIVMECKTNMLTARQRYAMNLTDTMRGIADQIATFSEPAETASRRRKGIGQIAFNLSRILAGEQIRSDGVVIDVSSVPVFHPAVVLYDDDIVNHAVRIHLHNEMTKWFDKHGIDRSRVGQTLLFSLKDIEYLEQLAEYCGVETLLRDYIHFVEEHPNEVQSLFHEFALARYPKETRLGGGYVLGMTTSVLRTLQQELTRRKPTT